MKLDFVAVFSQPLVVLFQFVAAMLMYCWRQPRREGFALRMWTVVTSLPL